MAGVYISFPFCGQKCTYCNFASGVAPVALQEKYLAALPAEIRNHAWRWRPETLYLGGGTPSSLEPGEIEKLLSAVPGNPWLEATIEAAPGTVSREKAAAWRRCGINRVSLGVQSFVTREIRRTGRRHTAETVLEEAGTLRDAGIGNFNIDLIAGLPGQTAASWRDSLEWLERLEAPHVSVYMLEVDEDSRLGKELLSHGSRYGAGEVPPEEAVVEMYETAAEYLRGIGVQRYEISNFARPGFESRHNLKYWRLEPYAGFGADAHSFDGSVRRQNVETAEEYVRCFETGRTPCLESEPARPGEEHFFVGLRLQDGIRPLPEEWRRFDAPIQRFVRDGLLERDGEVLRLTAQGILVSNEIFQEFVNV